MSLTTSNVSTATAFSSQRKVDRFHSNGNMFRMYTTATSLMCEFSADNGATWNAPAVGSTIDSLGYEYNGSVYIDESDYIHLAVSCYAVTYYFRGTPNGDRTEYTWTAPLTINNPGRIPDLVAHADGTGWKAHVVYSKGTSGLVPTYQRLNITSAGVITLEGSAVSLTSTSSTEEAFTSIWLDASKNYYVTWQMGRTGSPSYGTRFRKGTYSAGTWTLAAEQAVTTSAYPGMLGMGPCVVDANGGVYIAWWKTGTTSYLWYRTPAGVWSEITGIASSKAPSLAVKGTKVYVFVQNSGLQYYTATSGTLDSMTPTMLNGDTAIMHISARRMITDVGDVVGTTGVGPTYTVASYLLSFNEPPLEPTITLASSAFPSSSGTDVTIAHNDTDQMSAWAWKYVLGSETRWWDNTTKAFDKTSEFWNTGSGFSVTITASDLVDKFVMGNVYQLYAATKDSQSAVGPYNSVAVLATIGNRPNVSITSDATSNVANYTVEWIVDQLQSAYRVRVLNGSTQVSTTDKVSDTSGRARTVSLPDTGVTYTVEVTVWDQSANGGIQSVPATLDVTTSFTSVATPDISVNPLSSEGYIGITWVSPAPTGEQPTCSYVDLYREEGNDSFIRIATGLPESGSFSDYNVASDVVHTYFVRAIGSNGTVADSLTASGSVTLTFLWVHDVFDPTANIFHLLYEMKQAEEWTPDVTMLKFAGRSKAVATYGTQETENIAVSLKFTTQSEWKQFKALGKRKATLCIRSNDGTKRFGTVTKIHTDNELCGGVSVSVEFTETDFLEAV